MNTENKTCAVCGKSNPLFGECCNDECFTKYAFYAIDNLAAKRDELPNDCFDVIHLIGFGLRSSFVDIEKFTKECLHNPVYAFRWADKVILESHKFEIYRLLIYQINRLEVVDRSSLAALISSVVDDLQVQLNRASFIEYSTSPMSNLTQLKKGEVASRIVAEFSRYVERLGK